MSKVFCRCHANRIEHIDWALARFGNSLDQELIDKALDERLEAMKQEREKAAT